MAATPDSEKPKLITIAVSHFCEKARWSLERFGIDYMEEAHAPGFHAPAVKGSGGKGTVPCLVFPDGKVLDDSYLITKWASEKIPPNDGLFPPGCKDEVDRWCKRFDSELGPDVRMYFYSYILFLPSISGPALMRGLTPWSLEWVACSLGYLWPARLMMRVGMKISRENGDKALARINALFNETDALLRDGRRYLCGEQFTAADLTLAALAGGITGFRTPGLPPLEGYPRPMQEEFRRWGATATGKFIMRLLTEERQKVVVR